MLIDIFWACAVFNSDCSKLLVTVRIFLYLIFLSYECYTSFSGFSKSAGLLCQSRGIGVANQGGFEVEPRVI